MKPLNYLLVMIVCSAFVFGCGGDSSTVAVEGKEMTIDLGGGVKMEFVWIQAVGLWVGKYEVTNGEYRRFEPSHNSGSSSSGDNLNGDRQPVVQVSYENAEAFAEWLRSLAEQANDKIVARLPDVEEWTIFAECGDGREYPWGNEWPPAYGNYRADGINGYSDGYAATCPVADSGRNPWGLYGVGGNASEWTSEQWGARSYSGGSGDVDSKHLMRCSNQGLASPAYDRRGLGFRLVVVR